MPQSSPRFLPASVPLPVNELKKGKNVFEFTFADDLNRTTRGHTVNAAPLTGERMAPRYVLVPRTPRGIGGRASNPAGSRPLCAYLPLNASPSMIAAQSRMFTIMGESLNILSGLPPMSFL